VLGRQLTCEYDYESDSLLWPNFHYCKVSWVNLSERYKTIEHSFSGTAAQKSAATVVHFYKPSQIEFLPTQILNDFPRFNGIDIQECNTLKTIREELFTQDFNMIEYLNLYGSEIATIEPNAFQHLPNLKWISLQYNQLRSLPHQIFKNNLELMAIILEENKINSITPDFFKNLNNLQWVTFDPNRCIDKYFGCWSGSCSVSQEELDSDLSTCYRNCLSNRKCASKSG
jgi:hypothetical protein